MTISQTDSERGSIELRMRSGSPRRRAEIEFAKQAKDDERRRIAQDLHDDLGGLLFGMKSCLTVALNRAEQAGARLDPVLNDAAALANVAFDTVRRIAAGLRPGAFEKTGVWQSLRDAMAAIERRTSILCDLRIDANVDELELGKPRELMIFRVVQEALTNAERHARASRLSLRISRRDGVLEVLVGDDGIGLDERAPAGRRGMGMQGMRDRASAFNGIVTIGSATDAGTVVRLVLPLEQ